MKKILVTGGTGYIGSHIVVELIAAGYEPVIVDNFSNSKPAVIERLQEITGQEIAFHEVDMCDKSKLAEVFDQHEFEAVIHLAALKAIAESIAQPLRYYTNNLVSTLNLCELMIEHGVNNLVFSSSATVYGFPETMPITEDQRLHAVTPYGQSKLMAEQILRDLVVAEKQMKVTLLRYFNPIGAHESGKIGEDPNDIPNNLLPYVSQVAAGKLDKVRVFGNDYDTPDGTGVRDYIHVVDLAKGHIAAIKHMPTAGVCEAYNLGTGRGFSVLEAIEAFRKASGKEIPYEVVVRRPGDIGTCYADPSKAKKQLHWKSEKTLQEACNDAWRWQEFISKS